MEAGGAPAGPALTDRTGTGSPGGAAAAIPSGVPPRRRLGPELRRHRAAVATGVVGSVAGLALGAVAGTGAWPVYAVVLLLGAAAVTAVDLRVGLSRLAVWGLVVFALGHVAGGMVPVGDGVLYQRWLVGRVLRFDNLQHAWGFGFAGRAVWEALRPQLGPAPSRAAAVALVVLGGTGLGALNEVIEYVLTKLLPETNVGGYENTARDLVANLTGSGVAAALTVRGLRRGRPAAHDAAGSG